jgi:Flp pilus assembly protein TadD
MDRFVRRAALAAATVLGNPYRPRPFTGVFLASSPPSASGHLGLVRARPALLDLNSLLSPEAFLLDATHALGAAALRHQPMLGGMARGLQNIAPKMQAAAAAAGDIESVQAGRHYMALLDAVDGRFEDALHNLGRLAEERPYFLGPRLAAAAICDLLGRPDQGDRWLIRITGDEPPRDNVVFRNAVVAATLGGAADAVAGSQGAVASAALMFIYEKLWGAAFDGDMSVVKKVLITTLLNRLVKRKLREDAVVTLQSVSKLLRSGTGSSVAPPSPSPIFNDAEGSEQFVLQASQALLSAVVLRAPPLTGERIRGVTRATKRDLARAVQKGDTAAAADLRLLLALLAARDGRFDAAVEGYQEAAREHPSDPRPSYLLHLLYSFGECMEESDKWNARYERLAAGSSDEDRASHVVLKEELVVALTLGGARTACRESFPGVLREIVGAAGSRVDAALVSALRDENTPVVDRLELRALRAFLYAVMWSAVKDLDGSGGITTN